MCSVRQTNCSCGVFEGRTSGAGFLPCVYGPFAACVLCADSLWVRLKCQANCDAAREKVLAGALVANKDDLVLDLSVCSHTRHSCCCLLCVISTFLCASTNSLAASIPRSSARRRNKVAPRSFSVGRSLSFFLSFHRLSRNNSTAAENNSNRTSQSRHGSHWSNVVTKAYANKVADGDLGDVVDHILVV